MDKLALNTDSKIEGEFSLAEAFPNGKLIFKATDGSRAKGADAISAALGVEATAAGKSFITAGEWQWETGEKRGGKGGRV